MVMQSYNFQPGEQKPYSVVIPCAQKDAKFVGKVMKYVWHNLKGCEHIYIIAKNSLFGCISKWVKKENPEKYAGGGYTLIDENSLVRGFNFDAVRDCLLSHPNVNAGRVGWYFQQFLKFAFAQTEYCGEYYLTWDADTLPTSQIYFFQDGHPLFTAKTEYHEAYFHTLEKLLGMGKTAPFSFIAEHMMFCKEVVFELIEAINCSPVLGDSWFEKIINACDFKPDDGSIFSEFETYGTFCCLKHPDLYQVRQLNTFRCAAMLCGRHITDYVMKALSSLDIATFEIYHDRVERRKLILQRRLAHPMRTARNALKKLTRLVGRGS